MIVTVTSVINQAGPEADRHRHQRRHVSPVTRDFGLVALVAGIYLASIVVSALLQRRRPKVTGRLAAYGDERPPRQGVHPSPAAVLDFYTEEKAGVVMTRMTSDIENLQQLLQDGLAQFAVQGLTMIVITSSSSPSTSASPSSPAADRAGARGHVPLVPESLPSEATNGSGTGSRTSSPTSPRAFTGSVTVTAHNRQRHNIVHHRNVVGRLPRRQQLHRPDQRCLRPRHAAARRISARPSCSGSAATWCSADLSVRGPGGVLPLPQPLPAPIQLLVQQYNTFQQGQASVFKLRTLLRDRAECGEAPDAVELPPISGEIVFDHVTFGYDPSIPVIDRREPYDRCR